MARGRMRPRLAASNHGRASRNFSLDSQDWADYMPGGATGYVVFFSIGTYGFHIFIYSHFFLIFLYILFVFFFFLFFRNCIKKAHIAHKFQ